jgi:hypothetical protein
MLVVVEVEMVISADENVLSDVVELVPSALITVVTVVVEVSSSCLQSCQHMNSMSCPASDKSKTYASVEVVTVVVDMMLEMALEWIDTSLGALETVTDQFSLYESKLSFLRSLFMRVLEGKTVSVTRTSTMLGVDAAALAFAPSGVAVEAEETRAAADMTENLMVNVKENVETLRCGM